MSGTEFILLFFFGPLLTIIVLGAVVFLGLKLLKGNALGQADEARLIQEIHQGLSGLETRIEVLETILLESERKERHEAKS